MMIARHSFSFTRPFHSRILSLLEDCKTFHFALCPCLFKGHRQKNDSKFPSLIKRKCRLRIVTTYLAILASPLLQTTSGLLLFPFAYSPSFVFVSSPWSCFCSSNSALSPLLRAPK